MHGTHGPCMPNMIHGPVLDDFKFIWTLFMIRFEALESSRSALRHRGHYAISDFIKRVRSGRLSGDVVVVEKTYSG